MVVAFGAGSLTAGAVTSDVFSVLDATSLILVVEDAPGESAGSWPAIGCGASCGARRVSAATRSGGGDFEPWHARTLPIAIPPTAIKPAAAASPIHGLIRAPSGPAAVGVGPRTSPASDRAASGGSSTCGFTRDAPDGDGA